MRAGTTPLIIVFVASVVISGLLAGKLSKKQQEIAVTRDRVTKAPLAGFHKFAADVEWMRFIQYCGATGGVTAENADEFKDRIDRIIGLDPDFGRIYYEGALMLAARAPHHALDILDRGIANPRLSSEWRLPLTAGSIVSRPQLDKVYRDEEPDLEEITKARDYFSKAVNISGRPDYALNALVRHEALLREGDYPREIKELEVWFEEWRRSAYGMMGEYGDEMMEPVFDGEMAGYGMEGGGTDVSEQVMRALRSASRKHPNHPRLKELSKEVLDTVFKSQRIDPHSLQSYAPGDQFSAFSGKPVDVYGVCRKCGKDSSGRYTVLKGPFCHVCGSNQAKEYAPEEVKPERGPSPGGSLFR